MASKVHETLADLCRTLSTEASRPNPVVTPFVEKALKALAAKGEQPRGVQRFLETVERDYVSKLVEAARNGGTSFKFTIDEHQRFGDWDQGMRLGLECRKQTEALTGFLSEAGFTAEHTPIIQVAEYHVSATVSVSWKSQPKQKKS